MGVPERRLKAVHMTCHVWGWGVGRDLGTEGKRKKAQPVKLLPISSPGIVTYRKSKRVNERSDTNQIAYPNHLGNIQQLIKHPVLRPISHSVLYGFGTGGDTSDCNERCHHCKCIIRRDERVIPLLFLSLS